MPNRTERGGCGATGRRGDRFAARDGEWQSVSRRDSEAGGAREPEPVESLPGTPVVPAPPAWLASENAPLKGKAIAGMANRSVRNESKAAALGSEGAAAQRTSRCAGDDPDDV